MNNFTTKTTTKPPESLPRSGHVNEVCKEWLVREDGALAYKLQSQEINDFYKGNRFRNAVVREDFPTALHEQIKESEQAQRQAEVYRRRLNEQEEHDKRVAKEIADKLERDLQEQQQKELQESEIIAQQMQEIYVNLPPVPPPSSRNKSRPPPRPSKASIKNQPEQQHVSEVAASSSTRSYQNQNSFDEQHNLQYAVQLQQQHFSNTDNYVGLSLLPNIVDLPTASSSRQQQQQQKIQTNNHQSILVSVDEPANHRHYHHQHQTSNTSSNSATSTTSLAAQPVAAFAAAVAATSSSISAPTRRNNVYEYHQHPSPAPNSPRTPNSPHQHSTNTPNKHSSFAIHQQSTASASPKNSPPVGNMSESLSFVDELVDYSDVADSIRHYEISQTSTINENPTPCTNKNINKMLSPSHENLLRTEQKFQKLSPEKYDQLVGNHDGVAMGGVPLNNVAVAAAAERHMQQHADDIELYVDPCDYASLREIGLPMSEIKEMSKKLKQEQKDELLARRLQAMESTGNVRQEERDRMLAIEAQDKELAKMLQEREKAKAKRAKEKARQRKSQQKEANGSSSSSTLCGTSTNCGPLLPLPQDCMSMSSGGSPSSTAKKHNTAKNQLNQNTNQPAPIHEDPIDLEAYSNPIDVLNNSRLPNGTLTNGSLGRDSNSSGSYRHTSSLHRDDDIYTLPVDSCRPGQQRPVSLHVAAETVQQLQANSMTRSEHYAAETIDSHDVAPHMKYSKSGNFDQSSSPTPPYMPIQGTRRSNSSEDRKKKSKDNKCTHQ